MIKAVNMKGYRFGKLGSWSYKGFGMLDTDTNSFISQCGRHPWTFDRKKDAQRIIDEESWIYGLKRAAFTAAC